MIQPRRQSDTSEALRISPSDFYMPFLTPMSELLPNPPSGAPHFGFSLTHAESFVGRPERLSFFLVRRYCSTGKAVCKQRGRGQRQSPVAFFQNARPS